ncbi:hypothetical protein [Brasilonema bromeliae]|uniref:Uncharacterized protein n=1 Tax=Brasilonema bromeliae SPC951 TaxID=385972 RepID=A0ABX1P8K4_9CYAN|nr:hypothetical protein [Brasilonema bromeliae]NMG20676.1 hypothetical protein [Brasilonema bromeliae SPC951]
MDSKSDNSESGKSVIAREAVDWLLQRIFQLPKKWLIISIILILISTCEIGWSKKELFSFKFRVTNTTAIFLSLIWLPSILKVFALSGGALKTPLGEIGGSGMKTMLESLTGDSLGFLIEQTKRAEEVAPPKQQEEMRQIRREWQKVYASTVPVSDARQEMEGLAERYKQLRITMSSGPQRTFEMESVTGQMRALAPEVKYSVQEVKDLLQSPDQGKRLLGLSVVEWSGDAIYFDLVLHLISHSETAFEQTSALRSVGKMVSKLDTHQKKNLQAAIIEQRNFNEKEQRWIKPNSNRWVLSDRILSALNE